MPSSVRGVDCAHRPVKCRMTHRLSLDHIAETARIIDPVFLATPQFVSEAQGVRQTVEVETPNPVRCFKGRRADYDAATLSPGAQVVTASSSNLGQALISTPPSINPLPVGGAGSQPPVRSHRRRRSCPA